MVQNHGWTPPKYRALVRNLKLWVLGHFLCNFTQNESGIQGANKKMDPLLDKFAPFLTIFPAILRILTFTVYSNLTKTNLHFTPKQVEAIFDNISGPRNENYPGLIIVLQ